MVESKGSQMEFSHGLVQKREAAVACILEDSGSTSYWPCSREYHWGSLKWEELTGCPKLVRIMVW